MVSFDLTKLDSLMLSQERDLYTDFEIKASGFIETAAGLVPVKQAILRVVMPSIEILKKDNAGYRSCGKQYLTLNDVKKLIKDLTDWPSLIQDPITEVFSG